MEPTGISRRRLKTTGRTNNNGGRVDLFGLVWVCPDICRGMLFVLWASFGFVTELLCLVGQAPGSSRQGDARVDKFRRANC